MCSSIKTPSGTVQYTHCTVHLYVIIMRSLDRYDNRQTDDVHFIFIFSPYFESLYDIMTQLVRSLTRLRAVIDYIYVYTAYKYVYATAYAI